MFWIVDVNLFRVFFIYSISNKILEFLNVDGVGTLPLKIKGNYFNIAKRSVLQEFLDDLVEIYEPASTSSTTFADPSQSWVRLVDDVRESDPLSRHKFFCCYLLCVIDVGIWTLASTLWR